MGFAVMMVYTAMALLSPADIIPALAPYRIMLVLAALAIAVSVGGLLSSLSLLRDRQFLAMTFFTGWLIVSWIPHGWLGGILMAVSTFIPSSVVYFLAMIHIRSIRQLRFARAVLIGCAIYMIVMGLIQYPTAARTLTETPYVMVQHVFDQTGLRLRAQGMLHDPNTFGHFLLMCLPLLFIRGRASRSLPVGAILIATLVLIAAFMTGSRGTMLGLALLVGIYLRRKWRIFGTWVTVGLTALLVAVVNISNAGRSISLSGGMDRLALWSDGIGLFLSSPIWGIGFRQFTTEVRYTAHNSYLLCATELGFVGYSLWIATLLITVLQLNHVTKLADAAGASAETVTLGRWAAALEASLAVYLLTAYFLSLTYSVWLYLWIGISGAIFRMATAKLPVANAKESAVPFRPKWIRLSFAVSALSLFAIYLSVRVRAL